MALMIFPTSMVSGDKKAGVWKFAADEMLGKLARWLRIMGLDVAHRRPFPDQELLELATREDRVVLTRDTKLAGLNPPPRVWFIEHDLPFHQLSEVVGRAGIDPWERAFTRCAMCNQALVDAGREEVAGQVPPFVYSTQTEYRRCTNCGRIYWPGSHRARMERLFREVSDSIREK